MAMGISFLGTSDAEDGGVVGLYDGAGVALHNMPTTTTTHTILFIDGNIGSFELYALAYCAVSFAHEV
jgi:hypothetical protein